MLKKINREIESPTLEFYPESNFPKRETRRAASGSFMAFNSDSHCIISQDCLFVFGDDIIAKLQDKKDIFLGISFDPAKLELYVHQEIASLASFRLMRNGLCNPFLNLRPFFQKKGLTGPRNKDIYKDHNLELVTLSLPQHNSIVKTSAIKMRIPWSFAHPVNDHQTFLTRGAADLES